MKTTRRQLQTCVCEDHSGCILFVSFFLFFIFVVVGCDPRASYMPYKCAALQRPPGSVLEGGFELGESGVQPERLIDLDEK